jgi:hypothetical protein
MKKNTITLKDPCPRRVLIEGRTTGSSFAFCKQIGENEYETVQPLSPCKDYLNDVVWSEVTGKHIGIWGLSYIKKDIYKDGRAFMALEILPSMGSKSYTGYEFDKKSLEENIDNVIILLNHVEKTFKVPPTTVEKIDGTEKYLFNLSTEWCLNGPRISLFSQLIRIGMYWDGKGDPNKYIQSFKLASEYLWPDYLHGYNYCLKNKTLPVKPEAKDLNGGGTVHNYGFGQYTGTFAKS